MKKFAVLAVLAAAGAAQAAAYDAMYIVYDGGFGGATLNHYNAVASVLGAGNVDLHINPFGGVATALSNNTYNSVYVYDITSAPMTDAGDVAALGAWYNNSKSVVIDGRAYGAYFTGGGGNGEDVFAQNTAAFFQANGGGLYVGTDHEPDWTWNGNAVLAASGFNQIIGLEGGPATGFNASPLWAGVNIPDLDWSAQGWSVGHTPVGAQPNGMNLSNILYSGPGDPMISTSLVPAPGALALVGLGGLMTGRRRR